ncbi:NAD(P)H-hydrate dehydratase, partial [Candidatus Microgenomates bacterium]|nr:NAD(P)H-hydrate dehydratase [Candidatus Microgenomates bacterium]
AKESHKGQNGKLTIIGGSHLFHGASLWALKIASRIVDMVFYSSTAENNELTQKLKGELYDFIAVPRGKVEDYISQSDTVLIGPGLAREDGREEEEESTKSLTERLLKKFPTKKWVIDAGSLQMMEAEWLKKLNGNVIITPHVKEFEELFNVTSNKLASDMLPNNLLPIAKEYNCVILLKGQADIVCSSKECVTVTGGNEGMTKGGTGDVLAGLVAALSCKNDLFLAAAAGSFINKKAGEKLYQRVGPYFNASDLADEIPKVMKSLIFQSLQNP